jgi:iron complex outermembrane receptor protein
MRTPAGAQPRHSPAGSAFFLLLAVSGSSTFAQSVSESAASPSRGGLEEIIVTARKREEPLEKTPVAVTAVSDEELHKTFTGSLTDIASLTPNTQIRTAGEFGHSSILGFRGVVGGGANFDSDPPVAIYVDGLYQTTNTINLESLFGIESIELLRGPQGTLFGRNAFAGAINVTSKNPTGQFGSDAELTLGNNGRKNVDAALDFPFTDTFSGRLDVLSANSSGYYHNTLDGGNPIGGDANDSARVTLLYKPNDRLNILFKYNFVDDQSGPTPNKYSADPPGNLFAILYPNQHPNYGSTDLGPHGTGGPFDVGFTDRCECNYTKINSLSLKTDYSTGLGQLTSITGYQHVNASIQDDATGTPEPLLLGQLPYTIKAYTEEVRLLSQVSDRFKLLSGLYYLNDALYEADNQYIILSGTSTKNSEQHRHSAAAFLDGEYTLADGVHLALGARYTAETKNFLFGAAVPVPGGVVTYVPLSASWHNLSPKASIDYQLRPDTMIYATWSRGFKAGGFQALASTAAGAGPYGDETMDASEIGIKSFLWDRRARFSADVFYEKLSGLQRAVTLLENGVSNNLTINAADANSKGVEIESAFTPMDALTITANVGFLDAYYTSFCADFTPLNVNQPRCGAVPGAVDNTNLVPSNAPKWQAFLSVDYVVPLAGGDTITFHGDDNYSSWSFSTDDNAPIGYRRAAAFLNGSIKWSGARQKFFVSVWGRNLTDKIVTEFGLLAAPVLEIWSPTPPRTYGVTVGAKF